MVQKGESGRSVESGRSRVRVDGPSESRPSPILNDLRGNRAVKGVKVDGLKDDSGRFEGRNQTAQELKLDGSRGEGGRSGAGFEITTKILSCDRARFLEPLSKSVQHSVKLNRNRTIR